MDRRHFAALLTVLTMAGAACNDEVTDDCADCPDPNLYQACLDAANECNQDEGEGYQTCLDEARQLCE